MKRILVITFSVIFAIIILFLLYSRFIGTKGLVVKEYFVKNKNIPESFYGTKIVHISDIHYGKTIEKKEIKQIVKTINKIKPDIVIITGDILNAGVKYNDESLKPLIDNLNNIEAKMGKYIISGDNDILNSKYNYILKKLNYTNLDDNYQIIYNKTKDAILIAGLSTLDNKKSIDDKLVNINNTFSNKNIKYRILLMHEPDAIKNIDYKNYNLILAGHSLNGKINLPLLRMLPKNAKKYYKEHYKLDNTHLYISSGLGLDTTNFRFNNKPSINLYRLVNK